MELTKRNVRFTKKLVDALEANEVDYLIWDSEVPGFGLSVRKSGRKSYFLKYRVGTGRGALVRKPTIGTHGAVTVDQARNVAKTWLAKARLGGDPGVERSADRNAPLMDSLLERYLEDHARPHKKASSFAGDQSMINRHLRPVLSNRKVSDVERSDIAFLHKSLEHTPYVANRLLSLSSKIFNLAELWGMRPDGSNPCKHLRKFKEEKRRRFLSEAEVSRLGDALIEAESGELKSARGSKISPFAIVAIRLLILTGARKNEILNLRWSELNLGSQRLELSDSKTGAKFVYLPDLAVTILERVPRLEGNPFVIAGGKAGSALVNLKDPWNAIRDEADLAGVRIHDLRHSFASFGASDGMSLPIIGALLGHREAATTSRYAHLSDDPLRAAAGAIGSRIAEALG